MEGLVSILIKSDCAISLLNILSLIKGSECNDSFKAFLAVKVPLLFLYLTVVFRALFIILSTVFVITIVK